MVRVDHAWSMRVTPLPTESYSYLTRHEWVYSRDMQDPRDAANVRGHGQR